MKVVGSFGFSIASETLDLMKAMVDNGEVDTLVAERTWAELRAALGETKPSAFFELLRESGALARILPEIDAVFGVGGWSTEVGVRFHFPSEQ